MNSHTRREIAELSGTAGGNEYLRRAPKLELGIARQVQWQRYRPQMAYSDLWNKCRHR